MRAVGGLVSQAMESEAALIHGLEPWTPGVLRPLAQVRMQMGRAGAAMMRAGTEALAPDVAPELQGGFLEGTGQVVGSQGAFMGAYLAGGPVGPLVAGGLASAANATQLYYDVLSGFDDPNTREARAAAVRGWLIGGVLGLTEFAGGAAGTARKAAGALGRLEGPGLKGVLGRLARGAGRGRVGSALGRGADALARLDRAAEGRFSQVLAQAPLVMAAEGGQEALQQFLQNVAEDWLSPRDVDALEGVLEGFTLAQFPTFVLHTLVGGARVARRGRAGAEAGEAGEELIGVERPGFLPAEGEIPVLQRGRIGAGGEFVADVPRGTPEPLPELPLSPRARALIEGDPIYRDLYRAARTPETRAWVVDQVEAELGMRAPQTPEEEASELERHRTVANLPDEQFSAAFEAMGVDEQSRLLERMLDLQDEGGGPLTLEGRRELEAEQAKGLRALEEADRRFHGQREARAALTALDALRRREALTAEGLARAARVPVETAGPALEAAKRKRLAEVGQEFERVTGRRLVEGEPVPEPGEILRAMDEAVEEGLAEALRLHQDIAAARGIETADEATLEAEVTGRRGLRAFIRAWGGIDSEREGIPASARGHRAMSFEEAKRLAVERGLLGEEPNEISPGKWQWPSRLGLFDSHADAVRALPDAAFIRALNRPTRVTRRQVRRPVGANAGPMALQDIADAAEGKDHGFYRSAMSDAGAIVSQASELYRQAQAHARGRGPSPEWIDSRGDANNLWEQAEDELSASRTLASQSFEEARARLLVLTLGYGGDWFGPLDDIDALTEASVPLAEYHDTVTALRQRGATVPAIDAAWRTLLSKLRAIVGPRVYRETVEVDPNEPAARAEAEAAIDRLAEETGLSYDELGIVWASVFEQGAIADAVESGMPPREIAENLTTPLPRGFPFPTSMRPLAARRLRKMLVKQAEALAGGPRAIRRVFDEIQAAVDGGRALPEVLAARVREVYRRWREPLPEGLRAPGRPKAATREPVVPQRFREPEPPVARPEEPRERTFGPRRRARRGIYTVAARAGERGMVAFLRAHGGLRWEPDLERYLPQEFPVQRIPGLSSLVQRRGSGRGIAIDDALERAIESGFFPGAQLGDLSKQDLIDAIENDIPLPEAGGRGTSDLSAAVHEYLRSGELMAFPGQLLPTGAISRFLGGRSRPPARTDEHVPEDDGLYLAPESFLGYLARRVQDAMRPVRRAQEQVAEQGGEVEIGGDPYLAEELRRGRTHHRLTVAERAFIHPIRDILRQRGVDLEQADLYVMALHAPERNAAKRAEFPGRAARAETFGAGMTDEQAAAIVAETEALPNAAQYRRVAELVRRLSDAALAVRVETGLISAETAEHWRSIYPNYVPLRTLLQGEGVPRTGRASRSLPRQKRARGRKSLADSPIAFAMLQLEEAIVQGEVNRVRRNLLRFVEQNPSRYWRVEEGRGRAFLDPETGEFVRPSLDEKLTLAERSVGVLVEGQELVVVFAQGQETLARAIKGMGVERMGRFLRYAYKVGTFYKLTRTALNPDFLAPNVFRDIQTAAVNLKDVETLRVRVRRALSIKNVLGAAGAIHRNLRSARGKNEWDSWARRYREQGGPVSWIDTRTVETRLAQFEADLRNLQGGQSLWRRMQEVLTQLEWLNMAAENATRLAVFRAAVDSGVALPRAASVAKNITVNFEKHGELGPAVNLAYYFANAQVQGNARMILAIRRSPRVRKILAGLVVAGLFADLLASMMAGETDDERNAYDVLPDYVKDRNMVVPVVGTNKQITFPLAYGYSVFWNLGRNMGAIMRGAKRPSEAVVDQMRSVVDAFNPFGSTASPAQLIAPSLLDPLVQISENRTWTGSPLAPENFEFGFQRPDAELSWRSTSEAARRVARWINRVTGGDPTRAGLVDVHPDVLEHWFEFLTGGTGRFLEDTATMAQQGGNVPLREVPILRRFVTEEPEWGLRNRFYANLDEMVQVRGSIKYWQEQRDAAAARGLQERYAPVLRLDLLRRASERALREDGLSEAARREIMARFNRAFFKAKEEQRE